MKPRLFQFSLGPVQGFIAQARRTRDFWAGSFLLSWLSSVAVVAVESQEGSELSLPKLDDAYRHWLTTGTEPATGERPPQQGLVPNRISAFVGDAFDPHLVSSSVQRAWEALASQVFEHDLARIADAETVAIWQRQIAGFWELNWVLGDPDDRGLLERRKSWRTQVPADEPGLKCMMMDGWQELSGALSPAGDRAASYAREFWHRLRTSGCHSMASDLRPDEQLCAIAFVKRRFSRVFPHFKVSLPSDVTVHGWALTTQVPSVGYVAAAPWLARFLAAADREDTAGELSNLVHWGKRLADLPEFNLPIRCIQDAVDAAAVPRRALLRDVARLEGDLFFAPNLANRRLYEDDEAAKGFQRTLDSLLGTLKIGAPGRFFAVLRMDGDRVGAYLGSGKPSERGARENQVGRALKLFANQVAALVRSCDGWPIYAGGDDVLALLPAPRALEAALALRNAFNASMSQNGLGNTITLSAAVVFAPLHAPLGRVLGGSHELLNDVAKERSGRDALAVQVLKPGGEHLCWSMPWAAALAPEREGGGLHLVAFAQMMRSSTVDGWASKFAFRIRELISTLNHSEDGYALLPDSGKPAADPLVDSSWLLAAQVIDSSVNSHDAASLQRRIQALLSQCGHVRRIVDERGTRLERQPGIREDAMLLARFLATELSEA